MAETGYGKFKGHFVTENFGNVGLHVRSGKQVIRKAISEEKESRSAGQMYQRLKMLTAVPLYRAISEAIALGWENVPAGQSQYNRFIGSAMRSTPFGMSKTLFDKGGGIAWAAQITSGSLPTISVNGQISNIVINGLTEITVATTVGELAKAIVESNPGVFAYDDELAFIEVLQSVDSEGVPRLSCTRSAIILERDSQDTLAALPSLKGFAIDGDHLAVKGTPAIGAFAWVHTRTQDGQLLVSTQNLIPNNDAVLKAYSEPAKLRLAAMSLGANLRSEKFLKPTTLQGRLALKAFDINTSSVKGALGAGEDGIVAVEFDGKPYLVGDEAPVLDTNVDDKIVVTVSDITKLGSQIMCKINGSNVSSPVREGNTITMPIPSDADGQHLMVVGIADPTHTWRLEF